MYIYNIIHLFTLEVILLFEIRKATMSDTQEMYALINQYADEGKLLHRTMESIYEHLQCFIVAVDGVKIVGTASLHILERDLAEIRSLAVHPEYNGKGIGKRLVKTIVDETKALGIQTLLTLTYQEEFFKKCHFKIIEKSDLPMAKVWKDCMTCPKIDNCDEIAMTIDVFAKLES